MASMPSLVLLSLLLLVPPTSRAQISSGNLFSPVALSISLSSDRASIGGSVTIRCHVNPNSEKGLLMTKSSMTLYCPVTDERTFCFQNCVAQAHCNLETRECRGLPELERVRCRSIKQASGELIYEYTVEDLTAEWFDWRRKGFACASAAETTEWRQLHQATLTDHKPAERTTSTSTSTTSTTTSTSTTTTTPKPTTTEVAVSPTAATPKTEEVSRGWFNFFRNASQNNGSFWTPEMIIVIALVALALSLIINSFFCVCWIVTRRRKKSTSDESMHHKPIGVQPFGWIPVDPRFSGHPSQKMTPRTGYRIHMDPSGQSLSAASATDEAIAWMAASGLGLYDNAQSGQTQRSHPEGGCMSNFGGGRSSDSGVSLAVTGTAITAGNSSSSPLRYYPLVTRPTGFSSPGTPRSRVKLHRFSSVEPTQQQACFAPPGAPFYAACLELPKRCSSRETVFSERALSDAEGRYFIPLVLGGGAPGAMETGSMRAISTRQPLAAFGAPLWNPDTSLIEEPGVGGVIGGVADGASVVADDINANNQDAGGVTFNSGGAGSGSTSYASSRPTPRNMYLRQYGPGAINAVPIVASKAEPKIKTSSPPVNDEVSVTPAPGQNSAEVQKWLQSVPQGKRDFPLAHHHHAGSKHLGDSLNTEYDVASDWSERDPMLLPKGVTAGASAAVTDATNDQNSSVS